MKQIILFITLTFTALFPFCGMDDAIEILRKVDNTRAPGDTFSSVIEIVTTENKQVTERNMMKVKTKIMEDGKNRSVAVTLSPEKQKGRKMLLIGTDTWLYVPGAKKSIKISPAQKLSGNASTGDILSVNYEADYTPTVLGNEMVGKVDTIKLELMAKTSRVTYYKILLYVKKGNYQPVKSEYYTKSGKLLKKGYFRKYQRILGRDLCTELLIVDEIFKKEITVVRYKEFKLEDVSVSSFNKELLKDLKI